MVAQLLWRYLGLSLNFQICVRHSEYTNKLVHTYTTNFAWWYMMLILKEACAFALHKNSFKQCRSTFSKTWGGIISTFLVQTLSFFHFAQVSDQIWKYDIESIRIIQTHTYTFLTPCKLRFLLGGLTIFIPVFTFFAGQLPKQLSQLPKIFLKPPSWRLWRGEKQVGWVTRLAEKRES